MDFHQQWLLSVLRGGRKLTWEKALGPASVMPTLTIKCDAAANPITLLLSAMGKTSAPVVFVSFVPFFDIGSEGEARQTVKPCCAVQHAIYFPTC
jgi:hypothetical protein